MLTRASPYRTPVAALHLARHSSLLLTLAALAAASPLPAATINSTWIVFNGSGNWSTPANWFPSSAYPNNGRKRLQRHDQRHHQQQLPRSPRYLRHHRLLSSTSGGFRTSSPAKPSPSPLPPLTIRSLRTQQQQPRQRHQQPFLRNRRHHHHLRRRLHHSLWRGLLASSVETSSTPITPLKVPASSLYP